MDVAGCGVSSGWRVGPGGAYGAGPGGAGMTQRVVAYLRVSTQGQVDNGYCLDNQEAACRARAATTGADIVAVLREEGVSGAKAARPVLAEALGMLKNGQADAVMVYRLDRLARDLVLQEILLNEITAAGGVLLSATAGEDELLADPNDPTRKMMRQMLGAFAEYERALIALRLAAGRAAKRKAGSAAIEDGDYDSYKRGKGSGSYPFGWDKDGPVRREQQVLSVIKTMLRQDQTTEEIAYHLNSLADHQPRHAEKWSARSVGHVATKAKLR